ncbi:PAS domain-containing sensor histidine kinase [Haloarchaeobius sp. DFWS5]|uniref:sensor histidine kinase n=1 Tax=Haloarchaeobius sp. DFWS5 TaxID=3446114 RepID=UPI003EB9DBFD
MDASRLVVAVPPSADGTGPRTLLTDEDGFEVVRPADRSALLDALDAVDCIVSPTNPASGDVFGLLEAVRAREPSLPFLVGAVDGSDRLAGDGSTPGTTEYVPLSSEASNDELAARITDSVTRQRAILETGEYAQLFERLLETTPNSVVVVDQECEILFANERLGRNLGVDPAELVGRQYTDPFWEITDRSGDPVPMEDRTVPRVLATGEPVEGEVYGVDAPGKPPRYVSVSSAPIFGPNGSVEAVMSISTDVTAQITHQRELARYEAIVENVEDVAFVIDQTETLQFVSTRSDLLFGRSPDELVDNSLDDFVHRFEAVGDTEFAEEFGDLHHAVQQILAGHSHLEEVELDVPVHDGWMTLSFRLFEWDAPDGSRNVVGLAQDVTDRVGRERRLARQNQQLAVLNRVLRHDIRNDANVVLGWGELLREYIDDPEGEERLDIVLETGQHVIDLTHVAADLATAIAGEDEMPAKPVDPCDVLQSELWKLREKEPAATFVGLDDDACPPVVATEMLSSVFRNLLGNAVRHSNREHPKVVVSADVGPETVRFRVADDGPGVPDEQKRVIFGEGEKGLDSPGTGMGLYLVDLIVTEFGGSVWVEDNDPRGAVFVVELPRADRADGFDEATNSTSTDDPTDRE